MILEKMKKYLFIKEQKLISQKNIISTEDFKSKLDKSEIRI